LKMRNLLILFLMLASISCQFPSFQAKPVTIDGLGSLSSIKDKQLSEDEFNKLLKSTSKIKRVNEEDAKTLFEIFKLNTPRFSNASQNIEADEIIAGNQDVERYLKLIMDYEQTRKSVEEIVWREAKRILAQRVDFLNPKSNAGGSVGQFMKAYLKAFSQTLETNKDKETIINDKEGSLSYRTNILTLKVFEEKAQQTINQNQANREEKKEAEQFLQDIKTYNEAMPADEKILDANGGLVDPNAPTTNGGQRINMNRLAQGGINYHNDIKAEEASRRIGDIVQPTADTIQLRIKGGYKP
jgi:uncharacterized protein YxeA